VPWRRPCRRGGGQARGLPLRRRGRRAGVTPSAAHCTGERAPRNYCPLPRGEGGGPAPPGEGSFRDGLLRSQRTAGNSFNFLLPSADNEAGECGPREEGHCSAGPALRPCGSSTAPRSGRRGEGKHNAARGAASRRGTPRGCPGHAMACPYGALGPKRPPEGRHEACPYAAGGPKRPKEGTPRGCPGLGHAEGGCAQARPVA
jgi:hypothetical protein